MGATKTRLGRVQEPMRMGGILTLARLNRKMPEPCWLLGAARVGASRGCRDLLTQALQQVPCKYVACRGEKVEPEQCQSAGMFNQWLARCENTRQEVGDARRKPSVGTPALGEFA